MNFVSSYIVDGKLFSISLFGLIKYLYGDFLEFIDVSICDNLALFFYINNFPNP